MIKNENFILRKLDKQGLNDIFVDFLTCSNFKVNKNDFCSNPCYVDIDDGVRNFKIYYILKNISNGGWTDSHDDIKRIQVGNINKNLVSSNKIRTHMLCGLINYMNAEILVVWNSYRYTTHSTNRSCYININDIAKCYEKGYLLSHDFDQEIWLCDKFHFGLLIRDYINFNYIME